MKALTILTIILGSVMARADVWVNGYYTKSGHYVQGHFRSTADSNPYNNYSTYGNVNPYNGKAGTYNPYNHFNNNNNELNLEDDDE